MRRFKSTILSFTFLFFFSGVKAYEVGLKYSYSSVGPLKYSFQSFIDARINKDKPVGFTRVGIANKAEPMFLNKDFGAYCLNFFNVSGIKFNSSIKFIAVINQITLQETHSGGSEFSTASLSIDYYLADSNTCRLYYSSFVKTQDQAGLDITKKHASNLTEAFSRSFENLQKFIINGGTFFNDKYIPITGLTDSLNKPTNALIFQDQIKDGIYYSGKQIVNNSPQKDKWNFISQVDTSLKEIFFKDKSLLPNNNALFAFSKNNVLYLNIRKDTYRKVGIDDSTRLAYFKDLTRSRVSIGAGIASVGLGVLFGFAGHMAGSAIRSSNRIVEKIDRLYIDLENGLMDIEP